jgi:hypothetical protein
MAAVTPREKSVAHPAACQPDSASPEGASSVSKPDILRNSSPDTKIVTANVTKPLNRSAVESVVRGKASGGGRRPADMCGQTDASKRRRRSKAAIASRVAGPGESSEGRMGSKRRTCNTHTHQLVYIL